MICVAWAQRAAIARVMPLPCTPRHWQLVVMSPSGVMGPSVLMGPPAMLAKIHLHTGMAKLSQLVVPSLGGVMDQSVLLEELPAILAKKPATYYWWW